jgi:hypothetical protein
MSDCGEGDTGYVGGGAPYDGHDKCRDKAQRLQVEVDGLRGELECAKAFHDVAVKERDLARLESARLNAQLEIVTRENHERAMREARSLDDWRQLRAENERLRAGTAAQARELDRWRHGAPVEGDYICDFALEADRLREELEVSYRDHAAEDVPGLLREIAWLRAVERAARDTLRDFGSDGVPMLAAALNAAKEE